VSEKKDNNMIIIDLVDEDISLPEKPVSKKEPVQGQNQQILAGISDQSTHWKEEQRMHKLVNKE